MGTAFLIHKELAIVDHGGSDSGYRSDLLRFPDQHFSVACLCNLSIHPSQLARQVADIYLAAELKPELAKPDVAAVKLTEAQLVAKAGIYCNPDGDMIRKIAFQGGSLRALQGLAGTGVELKALSESRFRPTGQPLELRFEPQAAGGMQCVEVPDSSAKPVVYERAEEFKPAPEQLADYAGQYQSMRSSPCTG